MRKLIFIFIGLLSICSVAQTLQTDDNNVSIFYKIEQTESSILCNDNGTYDKNFSNEKIIIWRVTFGVENGHSESIVPRGIGIANLSISPNPIKPYSQNYCTYKPIEGYESNSGSSDQSLFNWSIRDYEVKEIKPREVITNTAYLYLYESQTPKLTNWEFLGYRLKKDFKAYDPILNDIVSGSEPLTLSRYNNQDEVKSLQVKFQEKVDTEELVETEIDRISSYTAKVEVTDLNVSQNTEVKSKNKVDIVKTNKRIANNNDDNRTDVASIADDEIIERNTKSNLNEIKKISPVKEDKPEIENTLLAKCSEAKALEFKEKSNAATDSSAQRGYSWLALYYNYLCECENGSLRSDQLVAIINNVVDSYVANTNNLYGKIGKISKCTSPEKNQ